MTDGNMQAAGLQTVKLERLGNVAWIQAVGVVLVVFGHSMNGIDMPDFLYSLRAWVYTFHMPLFFLVSAYLFAYYGGFSHKGGYFETLKGKFSRLMHPYIIWNAAFVLPKILFSNYINDEVELSVPYFLKLAVYPRENILGHTWFLFVLFEMFVLAIVFEKLRAKRQLWFPVLALLILVNCFGVEGRLLAVEDVLKDAVFFWIGLMFGSFKVDDVQKYGKDSLLFIAVPLLAIIGTVVWVYNPWMNINTMILAVAMIITIGMIQIRYSISGSLIDFISRNAFAIFIVHWPVMLVIRLVLYQKLHLASLPTIAMMFIGGLTISMLIAWLAGRCKTPFMKSFTRVVLGM